MTYKTQIADVKSRLSSCLTYLFTNFGHEVGGGERTSFP